MKNTTKKWLTIIGCLAVCAILVVVIGSKFQKAPSTDAPLPPEGAQTSDVTVQTPSAEKAKEVSITPPDISNPAGTDNGAVSSGTEQTIQGDITKPEYTEEQLADPTQKPSGEKVTEPPKPVEHDKVEKPADSTPKSGGLPGFDNVPDGGANQVINADDMYENGNKIGNMD